MTLPRKPARYWGDGDFNALADAIEGVSDSMPITYNQEDPPVPPIPANSVWIDTNDGGRAYVWSGSDWVSLEGPQGPQGPIGNDGATGSEGPAGPGSYTHIAYANEGVSPWSGFSNTDSTNKLYIGMFVNDVEADPGIEGAALYRWTLIKGLDGANGVAGPQGDDGQTPYFHVAYANEGVSPWTGFSTTVATGKTWIGTYTDYTEADPGIGSAALYKWALFKGADGSNGSNGTDGARGAGFYHLSNGGASAPATAQAFADLADDVVPQPYVFQDRVTIFNNAATPPWSVTKFWDSDSWEELTQYIDGNLLVSGTVAANKLVAGSVVVTGGAAGDINSNSTTISGGKITTGTLSADRIDANGINASIITAGTLNVDRINAGSLNGTKLADNAVNGLKLKCAMGTLAINNVGRSVLGVGWASPTSATRMDLGGGVFAVRCYPSVVMSGSDYVIFIQPIGYNGWIPRVVAKTSTYFDVMFGDGTSWAVDPNTWPAQVAYFSVLALDT
jgi:hypothetical protein